jgi:hypothetical protein
MWDYVGIVRTTKRLQRAQHRIRLLLREIDEFYANFRVSNDLIELRNLVVTADLIVRCALRVMKAADCTSAGAGRRLSTAARSAATATRQRSPGVAGGCSVARAKRKDTPQPGRAEERSGQTADASGTAQCRSETACRARGARQDARN